MAYRDLTQPNNSDLYCNTINVKTHIGLPDPIDLQGHKIINLSTGTGSPTDGINKGYVDGQISAHLFNPANVLAITNTTIATPSEGAIVCSGGINCVNAYMNGELTVSKNDTPQINITRSSPTSQSASISLDDDGNVELTCSGENFSTDKKLICYETTHSSSANNGSITTAGGLGVAGNVYTATNFRIDENQSITKEIQLLHGARPSVDSAVMTQVDNFQFMAFSGTEDNYLYGSLDMPYDWRIGTDILIVVHFFNNSNVAGNVDWQLTYSISEPGTLFNNTGTVATTVQAPNSEYTNFHFMKILATISMSTISSKNAIVNWRLTRLGSTDTYDDVSYLCSIVCRYLADRFGSEPDIE